MLLSSEIPTNFSEDMRSNKHDGWIKAMEEYIAAPYNNNVWKSLSAHLG